MTDKPVTAHLTSWLIKESGFRDAQHVLMFVTMWGIARKHYREGFDVESFADYWELSRSQAFRRQARYRKAMHGWYPDPGEVCDALEQEWPKVFASDDPDTAILGILEATLL